jgi:HSP20 family protein
MLDQVNEEAFAMANITRWNPFREMATMQSALDKFFDESWAQWPAWHWGEGGLALDVDETPDHYIVTTDLPGVKAEDIHVSVQNELLSIDAEVPEQTIEHKDARNLVRERRYGRMSRSIRLPQTIDAGKVEAEYKDGTLKLTLPKSEEAKVKIIPVKVNGNK